MIPANFAPANFASDNVAGALPEVIAAVTEAASVGAMPYGNDLWTARVSERLRDVFECDLWAFPVATGTAANALALSAVCPPFGTVFCHPAGSTRPPWRRRSKRRGPTGSTTCPRRP